VKPEQEMRQLKALAELDGWTWRNSTSPYRQDGWWSSDNRGPFSEREMIYSCDLHKMLYSYDAIIPLIQKLCRQTILHENILWASATPAQLCEALLKATAKWSTE
jgi:hypothetical protein